MNKYQKHIFDRLGKGNSVIFSCCCPIEDEGVKKTASYGAFNGDNDTFTIQQDEDIKKTQESMKSGLFSSMILPKIMSSNSFMSRQIRINTTQKSSRRGEQSY